MDFITWFRSVQPSIPLKSADAVLKLTEEGGTVPFIARYRKEQTGNLDEVGIRAVIETKEKWDETVKRQTYICSEIEKQGKLSDELKQKINNTFSIDILEDIYLPYKQKKKTKATLAKEAGLQGLADWLWDCGHGVVKPLPSEKPDLVAVKFLNPEKKINDAAAALAGAVDIITEKLSEDATLRQFVRDTLFQKGYIATRKGGKAKPNSKFDKYFEFSESVQSLLKPQNSHRYLAARRGWTEEELTMFFSGPPSAKRENEKEEKNELEEFLLKRFQDEACKDSSSIVATPLMRAAKNALKAHVMPSIDAEVHRALKEIADEAAIKVFAENVRKVLMASPYGSKAVLGVDPGIRTGCKLAVIQDSGKYVANTVIYLNSAEEKEKSGKIICEVVKLASIQAVAVGNGTAGRETETFIRDVFKKEAINVPVVMVNESGASVYSASDVAREEFPDLDVTVRGAISIARRLQDPLAELVKVDPKSIGVGQYQHDVSPASLKKSLEHVVDSCVNAVGVNLNTASTHLLAHVSGIGPGLAKSIVEFREKSGLFKSRKQLLEVPRFSKKAFEQGAGFLRIPNGDNPLDNTGVHPERYEMLERYAKQKMKNTADFLGAGVEDLKQADDLKNEIGAYTFEDIVKELEKPGRDPRDEFVVFQFREDIHEVKDLEVGMLCPGIVTNVTNFGAFVDIGVHQDGLVHLSQLSDSFVKDSRDVVNPGDKVMVRVIEVNLEKNQIALSMKTQESPAQRQRDPRDMPRRPPGDGRRPQGGGRPQQGRGHDRGRDRDQTPRHQKPKEIFNNAFEQLAAMRDQLKSGIGKQKK